MMTAIGLNAPMTAASVRANITRFHESYMLDKAGEPMLLSMAQYLSDEVRGMDRCLALAIPAAQEALAPLMIEGKLKRGLQPIPIYVGIADPRPGFDRAIEGQIISGLERATGLVFSKTERQVLPVGHASSLMGIENAVNLIGQGNAELALVGGVDSYYDPDTLEWLDESSRLHSEANKDGFIPGEGAGFCLLASENFIRRNNVEPLAIIVSVASEIEPHPFTSDGICIGQGLTRVFWKTLNVVTHDDKAADWTVCDMNGESFRASEWAYAYLRTGQKHRDPLEIWHPANCYGDIGAASGTVLVGIAVASWRRSYARGKRSLIWASSNKGQRAAVLLQKGNSWLMSEL